MPELLEHYGTADEYETTARTFAAASSLISPPTKQCTLNSKFLVPRRCHPFCPLHQMGSQLVTCNASIRTRASVPSSWQHRASQASLNDRSRARRSVMKLPRKPRPKPTPRQKAPHRRSDCLNRLSSQIRVLDWKSNVKDYRPKPIQGPRAKSTWAVALDVLPEGGQTTPRYHGRMGCGTETRHRAQLRAPSAPAQGLPCATNTNTPDPGARCSSR